MSDLYTIYATQDYVDKKVPDTELAHQQLVTDGEGNKVWEHRTHWIEKTQGIILPENTPQYTENGFIILEPIINYPTEGFEYTVTWNDENYSCVCKKDGEGTADEAYLFGNMSFIDENAENTGEPFILMLLTKAEIAAIAGFYGVVIDSTGITSASLSIEGVIAVPHVNSLFDFKEVNTNLVDGIAEGALRTITSAEENLNDYMLGEGAFAEGDSTKASGSHSHAEGTDTIAEGLSSHAEGLRTKTSGFNSHAEGQSTIANAQSSHAEGFSTIVSGEFSHAEGEMSATSGRSSHVEGYGDIRTVTLTGEANTTTYTYTGTLNLNPIDCLITLGTASAIIISYDSSTITVSETLSSISITNNEAKIYWHFSNGDYSHAEGRNTITNGLSSHAEGYSTTTNGDYSHAEGYLTTTNGSYSHAEGYLTTTNGLSSHAEGFSTTASGAHSHAEGYETTASGSYSHAEGYYTTANGQYSHAEGNTSKSEGKNSHAEGNRTSAKGANSHAEGEETQAIGSNSHAEGNHTYANTANLNVIGEFNEYETFYNEPYTVKVSDTNVRIDVTRNYYVFPSTPVMDETTGQWTVDSSWLTLGSSLKTGDLIANYYSNSPINSYYELLENYQDTLYRAKYYKIYPKTEVRGKYVHIVGNGISSDERSNAHTLDWNGNAWYQGDVFTGGTSQDDANKLATETYVNEKVADLVDSSPETLNTLNELAAALGDDPNFATTVTNKIGKLEALNIENGTGTGSIKVKNAKEASGPYSFAEGFLTIASGDYSHAEGLSTAAVGFNSHAEGYGVKKSVIISGEANATTYVATSETSPNLAIGKTIYINGVHATITNITNNMFEVDVTLSSEELIEASATIYPLSASGPYSHAEGVDTTAKGSTSHAEGLGTTAMGSQSHAEGQETIASGSCSHAEGQETIANGSCSHAEGLGTIANAIYSHAQGRFNIEDTAQKYAHIVGNGFADVRSNAHTLDWDGNAWFAGDVYVGGASASDGKRLVTEDDVDEATQGLIDGLNVKNGEGAYSIVAGLGNTAKSEAEFAIGKYNKTVAFQIKFADYNVNEVSYDNKYIMAIDDGTNQNTMSIDGETGLVIINGTASEQYIYDVYDIAEKTLYIKLDDTAFVIVSEIDFHGNVAHVIGATYWSVPISSPIFYIGNGSSDSERSNAHTVDIEGNAWFAGDVYVGGTDQDNGSEKLMTVNEVTAAINAALAAILPTPTANDAGKILRVNAEGKYELVALPNAEEATF